RYQFKAGDKLPYEMEQKMQMTMNVAGQAVEMSMTQQQDFLWEIKSVDKDGKAKVAQRFERIRFVMDGPMGKTEYDSKEGKEPEDVIGKAIIPIFKALAGAEFTLDMDSRGVMSNLKMPEKLIEAINDATGAGAAGLGSMFDEEGMKRMLSQSGLILPEEAVTKGKSWEQKLD